MENLNYKIEDIEKNYLKVKKIVFQNLKKIL